jgi:hypothetical protein
MNKVLLEGRLVNGTNGLLGEEKLLHRLAQFSRPEPGVASLLGYGTRSRVW